VDPAVQKPESEHFCPNTCDASPSPGSSRLWRAGQSCPCPRWAFVRGLVGPTDPGAATHGGRQLPACAASAGLAPPRTMASPPPAPCPALSSPVRAEGLSLSSPRQSKISWRKTSRNTTGM